MIYIAPIAIVAIVFTSVLSIVKMALAHHENIERIRHGYPVREGTKYVTKDYIDVTDDKREHRQQ